MKRAHTYAAKRVSRVMEITLRMAERIDARRNDFRYTNRVEAIKVHTHYCEPGYETPPSKLIAVGNWNPIQRPEVASQPEDLILRLESILERLGVELEWSDEWGSCDDCNGLFRTEPDCHWWKPSYTVDLKKGEKLCQHCALTCNCPTDSHSKKD